VRPHYFLRPSAAGFDAWSIERLVELSHGLPVQDVAVDSIREVDAVYWFDADGTAPTVRSLVRHMAIVNSVNFVYPIILDSDGCVMDGMHRVAKALLEGRTTISAVRFPERPPPEYHDINPDDLPW
jgi:hypothetical protein